MRQQDVKLSALGWLGGGILAVCATQSFAAGFALIEQSARQTGNAYAGGAASANDASTLYFNPAGITRLPTQVVGALHYVTPSADFSGNATDIFGNPVSGGNGGDAGQPGLIPNFYITAPLGSGLYAGLGVTAPFALSTKYDADWKGRYMAIESEVHTVNFNPSVAYRINPRWSLGAGVSLQYIEAKLTQAVDQGSLCAPTQAQLQASGVPGADPANCAGLTPQGNDGLAQVKGDNWAGGFNVGLLYEPSAQTRVGLSYRSGIKQQLTGNARFSGIVPQFSNFGIFVPTSATASADLPANASLSVWHDLNTRWSLMADATWTGWSSFDELRIGYASFQPDTVIDESWNNSMRYAVGLDYRYNGKWTFRAGTAYDESPIPNSRRRTARIPGEDRIWASLGVGYRFSPSLALDLGYAHLFVDDPKINETSSNAGTLSGEYDTTVDIVSAQIVWNL